MKKRFVIVALAATLVAACESTLDLGGHADSGAPESPADAATETAPTTEPTCGAVCAKLDQCGYFRPNDTIGECIDDCRAHATAAELQCAAREPCSTMVSACAPTASDAGTQDPLLGFDISVCKSRCSSAHDFDCISASELTTCQMLCESSSKRNTYKDCATGSGSNCTKHRDCFAEFQKP